jgi:hypothetical protein
MGGSFLRTSGKLFDQKTKGGIKIKGLYSRLRQNLLSCILCEPLATFAFKETVGYLNAREINIVKVNTFNYIVT